MNKLCLIVLAVLVMAVLVSGRDKEKDSSLTEDQSGSRSNGRVSDACLETLLNYECICIMADCSCVEDNDNVEQKNQPA